MGQVQGIDSSSIIRPLLVDASGRCIVQSIGYVNGAWQKQPMGLGYSASVSKQIIQAVVGAGFEHIDGDAVPVGEIWIIEAVGGLYIGTVPTWFILSMWNGSVYFNLKEEMPPVSTRWITVQSPLTLKAGDSMRAIWTGGTAADSAYLQYWGRKVFINL